MTTYQRLHEVLIELINESDWHDLSALSTALMSGEWDAMSEVEQDEWLSGILGE